jgi:hypothetical protein
VAVIDEALTAISGMSARGGHGQTLVARGGASLDNDLLCTMEAAPAA